MTAARANRMIAAETVALASCPACRSEAPRDRPRVSISENPSRMPPAAESTIAVSSNGPWAVTNSKKLARCGALGHVPEDRAEKAGVEDQLEQPADAEASGQPRNSAARSTCCAAVEAGHVPRCVRIAAARAARQYISSKPVSISLPSTSLGELRRASRPGPSRPERCPRTARRPAAGCCRGTTAAAARRASRGPSRGR